MIGYAYRLDIQTQRIGENQALGNVLCLGNKKKGRGRMKRDIKNQGHLFLLKTLQNNLNFQTILFFIKIKQKIK